VAEEEEQQEEQEEVADEGVQRKSDGAESAGSGNKLQFIVLLVNVVALVAVAVMFWLNASKHSDNVSLQDIEEQRNAEAKTEGGGDGSEGVAPETHYVDESFMVNLSGSEGKHFAKVDVSIQIENDFVKAELEKIRPKIRDFIVIMLSSKSIDQISTADGVEFLREEIRNKINGYLTKGEIRDVLFTNFIVQ